MPLAAEGVCGVQNTLNIQCPSVSYTVTEQNKQLPKPFSDIICQPHLVLLPKEIRTEKCKNRLALWDQGEVHLRWTWKWGKGKLQDRYHHSPECVWIVHHWASRKHGREAPLWYIPTWLCCAYDNFKFKNCLRSSYSRLSGQWTYWTDLSLQPSTPIPYHQSSRIFKSRKLLQFIKYLLKVFNTQSGIVCVTSPGFFWRGGELFKVRALLQTNSPPVQFGIMRPSLDITNVQCECSRQN